MRRLRRGSVLTGLSCLLVWLGPLGPVVVLAGCATSSAGETATTRTQVRAERAEMEDDGMPAQVAPASTIRQQPDDPSEPFSRNYGPRPAARLAGPPTRMSSAEEEALIARAIAEHEMRRP
jgi:hypothetical protein